MTVVAKYWRNCGLLSEEDKVLRIRRFKSSGRYGDMIIFYYNNRKRLVTFARSTKVSSLIDFNEGGRMDNIDFTRFLDGETKRRSRESLKRINEEIRMGFSHLIPKGGKK